MFVYFEIDPHKAFRAGQSTQMYERGTVSYEETGQENQKLWVDQEKRTDDRGIFLFGNKG